MRKNILVPAINKFILQPFVPIFQVVCFSLAGYLVYVQFHTYSSNKNVSNIEYQSFKDGNEDVYPTFSICAKVPSGYWKFLLKEPGTYLTSNQSAKEYKKVLDGQIKDSLDYDKIRIDQIVMNINDLITKFITTKSDGKTINQMPLSSSGTKNSNSTLEISHYDTNRVCVTKTKFQKNSLISDDLIEIEMKNPQAKRLREGRIDLDFYVHQKGQLLRRLKHPTFHLAQKYIRSWIKHYDGLKEKRNTHARYKVTMNIVSVDVIRKRQDYVIPCDPNLVSEDNKIRQSMMTMFGCIPAFMAPFVDEYVAGKEFESCNQTQYAKINHLGLDFKQIQKLYTPPCTEMNSIVTVTDVIAKMKEGAETRGRLTFQLDYSTDIYRETVSVLAFDLATLWSQIGGFIGIFLGYSLSQVPEMAQQCIIRINTRLRNF